MRGILILKGRKIVAGRDRGRLRCIRGDIV